jgi:AP-1 complex subunit gamma-1
VLGEANVGKSKRASKLPAARKRPTQITEQDMLLDLMGGDEPAAAVNGTQKGGNNSDLLADILGGGTEVTSPTATSPVSNGMGMQPQQQQRSNAASIMDLFDTPSAPPQQQQPPSSFQPQQQSASNDIPGGFGAASPPPAQQQPAAHTAFSKPPLNLTFTVNRSPQGIQVQARFRNTSSYERLGQVNLQAAVPKTQKLQLQAISSSELGPGEEAGQAMRIVGVNGVS